MTVQIQKCRKNIMGTVSFEGQFTGMRKPQGFIVYPLKTAQAVIDIQSDHRYGQINLDNGTGVLSANKAQYANDMWLALSMRDGKAVQIVLAEEERETLRGWVKSTGGASVGTNGIVTTDNSGALGL